MNQLQVAQLDADGLFVGLTLADESPLEPGVFLIPAGCVQVTPPDIPSGMRARFTDGAFALEPIPTPAPTPAPTPRPFSLTNAIVRARDMRKPIIDSLVGMIVTEDVTGTDVQLVKTAIQQLKDITKQPTVLAATSDDEFDAVVMYLYRLYASALPTNVQVAFREAVS